ncbi:MAG TPA: UDP-N-acetylmuramoyl-L-alanyl-D-glutamate--2,6-diaminopimelate ligase, partial [Anaerolineae bacterium]|nr:UDP-N-acetylmuramoyl-L-alanyl-D-glutamate--2,6-diaminopimelate ligase [Anaerolineae bacterium]
PPPPYSGPDVLLTKLVEHTDDVQPGSCFIARVRATSDGHRWIGKAIEYGASLILGQSPLQELPVDIPENVVYWQVPDTAETAAWLAAAWRSFPSRRMVVVGITGTNGKTSTAALLHAILQAAGRKTGLISTLKAMIGEREEPLALHVSTPEAPVVQGYLRQMADAGVTHCVLEATSHGLAQHRVTAVDFDAAVITNITHEHLDYHGSFAEYVRAKSRLFEMVAADNPAPDKPQPVVKTAVLNLDDPISYPRLSAIPAPRQISYSLADATADVTAVNIDTQPQGTAVDIRLPDGAIVPVKSSLIGLYNVANMLAAAAAAHSLGLEAAAIQAGLEAVGLIHGRMHPIQKGQPFRVYVDFAHTPDGLEKTIGAARQILQMSGQGDGRIIAVFGSAGLRDPEKRRMMAEISAEMADLTILTAEDPRTESLDDILETMAQGCRSRGGVEGQTFWRIPDRGQAIHFALTLAQSGDCVLICGKGHEQSMCFGTTEHPWDDIEAVEIALDAWQNGRAMPDLGLPTFDPNWKMAE